MSFSDIFRDILSYILATIVPIIALIWTQKNVIEKGKKDR